MPGREVIRNSICFDLKIRSRASSNLAAVGHNVRRIVSSGTGGGGGRKYHRK